MIINFDKIDVYEKKTTSLLIVQLIKNIKKKSTKSFNMRNVPKNHTSDTI